jgi:hypothetical protein
LNVWWTATSPASGRFTAREVRSDTAEIVERFERLRIQGRGCLEVRRDDDFPLLTMGFQKVFRLITDEGVAIGAGAMMGVRRAAYI